MHFAPKDKQREVLEMSLSSGRRKGSGSWRSSGPQQKQFSASQTWAWGKSCTKCRCRSPMACKEAPISIIRTLTSSLLSHSPFNSRAWSSAMSLQKAPLSWVKPHHLPAARNRCLSIYFPLKMEHFLIKSVFFLPPRLILLSLRVFKRNINYTLNSFQQILHILPDSSII